jgi:hypothetical protein
MSDGALFGISGSTPTYLTAVFDADGKVLRCFPELVWTFLRGAKYVPCPGLILNNSVSASHLIGNERNFGRQWHEGLEIHLPPRSIPRTGTHLDGATCSSGHGACLAGHQQLV